MSNKEIKNPLVSIIVITYNSAKYVLETLESAKAQTYKNIELIVSDDCSTDDTVDICRKWIRANSKWFVRTELVTAQKNTGIPANCNRGVNAAQGVWVKLIAGDDALFETCINDYMDYIKNSIEEVCAIHSNWEMYDTILDEANIIYTTDLAHKIFNNPLITAKEQLILSIRRMGPMAVTVMLRKDIIVALGGFDETLFYEDVPMYIKINANNYKFHFMNKLTIKRRQHDGSITNPGPTYLYNDFFMKEKLVYDKIHNNYFKLPERIMLRIEYQRKYIFYRLKFKKTMFNYRMDNILTLPLICYRKYLLNKAIYMIEKRIGVLYKE